MKLVSMKRSAPKPVDNAKTPSVHEWYEEYPYDLRITLRKEEMDKLGLDLTKMNAKDMLSGQVQFMVKDISVGDSITNGKSASLTLQVIQLGIDKPEGKPKPKWKEVAKP